MNVSTRTPGAIIFTIVMTTAAACGPRTGSLAASDEAGRHVVDEARERLARSFEERSAGNGRTQFVSRTPDSTVVLSGDQATLALRDRALHMRVVGADASARSDASEELGGRSHYLIGNDPARWQTNVKTFGKVRFRNVYRGVDVVYYGHGQKLEYDFVVAPGADPDRIRLGFEGADGVTLDEDGGLRLRMGDRYVRMDPPSVYQDSGDGRRIVPGRYALDGSRQVRFEIGAYDHARRLTIDPVITYSTYFGGRGKDAALAVAVDSRGFIYLTGSTGSVDVNTFPIVNAIQPDFNAFDAAFVTKLTPDGSAIVYSTYLGGTFGNVGHAIAVDRRGGVYIAGTTNSTDFPLVHPVQTTCGGFDDAFVVKLNPAGSAFDYSTCLGGESNSEEGFGMVVDDAGNAYVTGYTRSSEFPTRHALQPVHAGEDGEFDAFLSVIRPDGSDFVYSTFLGGTGPDEGHGV
ncbi:MAG TPA: SBBP repeat-containing protein, partial [Kofleriaceae bacterium]|nr:SBBP repeat-containing protein [Kofleriaceae bacterium]